MRGREVPVVALTTLLDLLALILFALGAGWLLWEWSAGAAFAAAGGVVLGGSALADRPKGR